MACAKIEADIDRYLAVVKWARRRYTRSDGHLPISIGGKPATSVRIEQAAFERYVQPHS